MNAIAAYKNDEAITLEELAKRLKLKSRGYACELVSGQAIPPVALAKKLEKLIGKPWHEIIESSVRSKARLKTASKAQTQEAAA